MIHIDIEGKTPDEDWLRKADAVTEKILAARTPAARKKVIDANRKLWRELEPWLRELSHDKCWYSEAKDCASYWHIDHFRPKTELEDLNGDTYEGYYWLAFCWMNYRLVGSATNVPKSTKFPVRNGTTWIASPDEDVDDESPYLLDPIKPLDPGLLSFDEKGRAIAGDPENDWHKQRATVTIDVMNLNYACLTRGRQRCWEECNRRINRLLNLMVELRNRHSASKQAIANEIVRELRSMVAGEAQFSTVARTCVRSQGIKWLTNAITGN